MARILQLWPAPDATNKLSQLTSDNTFSTVVHRAQTLLLILAHECNYIVATVAFAPVEIRKWWALFTFETCFPKVSAFSRRGHIPLLLPSHWLTKVSLILPPASV